MYTVRRNAMAQPVQYSAQELEERIAQGAVPRDALVYEDGAPPVSWTQIPRFAHLAANESLGARMSGQFRSVGGQDPEALLRHEAARRARERRGAPPAAGRSSELNTSGPRVFVPEGSPVARTTTMTRIPLENEPVKVNTQWRGRKPADTYRALLDVPATEVFGLPWNADRNLVNLALLKLSSEIEKEATKEESDADRGWRDQVLELLAAIHSAYTNPAHQRPVIALQRQFERVPFVSEVAQFYTNSVARKPGPRTGPRSEDEVAKEFGIETTSNKIKTVPKAPAKGGAKGGAGAGKAAAGGDKAAPVDPAKAAEQQRIKMYIGIGAVLGVLALIYSALG